jgi:hypothetical protein
MEKFDEGPRVLHTINLENQKKTAKKEQWSITLHPAKPLSTQASTQIGSFLDDQGSIHCIQPRHIVAALRHAAMADNLIAAGFDLKRIGSHSLRSGGEWRRS